MLAIPHTILKEHDTFKLPTLSRFRHQVSFYPDRSQEQDLLPGSFCRSFVPRARVPVVQHLRAARAHHGSRTRSQGCCLSHQVNTRGSFFRNEPLFFLNLCLSRRGKGFPRCGDSSLLFDDAVLIPPLWDRFLLE